MFEYPFRVWKSSWNGNHTNEDEPKEKIKFMQQMEILMDRKFSEIGWMITTLCIASAWLNIC